MGKGCLCFQGLPRNVYEMVAEFCLCKLAEKLRHPRQDLGEGHTRSGGGDAAFVFGCGSRVS